MSKNFISIIVGLCVCFPLCVIAIENDKDTIDKFCKCEMNEKHLLLCKMKSGVVLESGTSLVWVLSNTDKERTFKAREYDAFIKRFGIDFSVYVVTFKDYKRSVAIEGKIRPLPTMHAYFACPSETITQENYDRCPLLPSR